LPNLYRLPEESLEKGALIDFTVLPRYFDGQWGQFSYSYISC